MAGKALITGGAGFLGARLAELLLARDPDARLVLTDLCEQPRLKAVRGRVEFEKRDLRQPAACRELVAGDVDLVYHFASLVSGGAEADFAAGMEANLYATLNLLEACRLCGRRPRFVFTSSLATFGGAKLPEEVDDYTFQHPQNSYGVAKVIGEQLLNDYSRKGFLDGRAVRLPAIVVRDEPNTAASGYVSGIIREPLHGRDYVCPVPPEARLPILSVRRCCETLAALADLSPGALGDFRSLNGPNLSPSAGEMAAAVRACAPPGLTMGEISFRPDPNVQRLVAAWPKRMRAARAAALGLRADASIEELVRDYVRGLNTGS